MEGIRKNELHPLDNPLILHHIFKGMGLTDLKLCRIVCRKWCEASSPIISERVSDVWVEDVYKKHAKSPLEFMTLMEMEDEDEIKPCTILCIHAILTFDKLPKIFWKICGSSIKKMQINFEKEFTRELFQKAILQYCTSLEALTITMFEGERVQEPQAWIQPMFPPNHKLKELKILGNAITKVSYCEILSHFPAIVKFTADNTVKYLDGFFHSLELARNNNPSNWQIKHLSFSWESISSPERVLKILERLNLSLETLNILSIHQMEDAITMKRFLTNQSATLKKLTLSGVHQLSSQNSGGIMTIFDLPTDAKFKNVTELILINIDLQSISVLELFPNLNNLELTGQVTISSYFPQKPSSTKAISSCKELSINVEHCNAESLRLIISKLSHVETLRLTKCDNIKFTVICELLTRLLRLHLFNCSIDDIGISGLTTREVRRINEGSYCPYPIKSKPNLLNLKNLQELEWIGLYNETSVPGYASSVYVEKLPHLRKLYMSYNIISTIRRNDQLYAPSREVYPAWERLIAKYAK